MIVKHVLPLLVKSHPPRVQVAEHPERNHYEAMISEHWIMIIITCGVKFSRIESRY